MNSPPTWPYVAPVSLAAAWRTKRHHPTSTNMALQTTTIINEEQTEKEASMEQIQMSHERLTKEVTLKDTQLASCKQ